MFIAWTIVLCLAVGAFSDKILSDDGYDTVYDAEKLIVEATALMQDLSTVMKSNALKVLKQIEIKVVKLNERIVRMFADHPPEYLNILHEAILKLLKHLQKRIVDE